jgi:glycerophosphoryl diester phosphodiesterase
VRAEAVAETPGCWPGRSLNLCRAPGALPKLVGHRGALAVAPENTMRSFELAWRGGADLVELDVRLSADGHVVVMHDALVDRTTDGTGFIAEKTLAEIKQLDAGRWFDPRFAGERVPTLAEVLRWAKARIGLLLELKFHPYGAFEPTLVPAVMADVVNAEMADQVAAISYQPRALVQLKAIAPYIQAGPLTPYGCVVGVASRLARRFPQIIRARAVRKILTRSLTYTLAWGCDIVAPNVEVVTPTLVRAAHARNLPVSCGGLFRDYPGAIAMGLDTVSADDPGVVRQAYL